MKNDSTDVAKLAIRLAMSTREEEDQIKKDALNRGYKTAAVDIGGKLPDITTKVLERALVASKRTVL